MNIERPTSNFEFEKMKKQTSVFNIGFHSTLDVQRWMLDVHLLQY